MFETRVHDFGTVASGSDAEFRFVLENKYVEDVQISHVVSSCGCASPSIEKQTLKTWEKGAIVAKFNTRTFRGHKSATIRVAFTKPYPAEVQLQIRGNILGDLSFQPGIIEFGEVQQSEKKRVSLKIIKQGSPNWRIQDVRSTFANVKVGLRETLRNREQVQYDMIVELQEDAPAGFINGELHIVTNDPASLTVPINFNGRVVPALAVGSEVLALGTVKPHQVIEKRIVLRAQVPFRVTQIESDDNSLKIEGGQQENRTQILSVKYTPNGKLGIHECHALIHTDLGSQAIGKVTMVASVEPD
ncbi:MAG TPA: DUF1573 domain-containing protein [Pirellulaceae bacterium]|nr:DUF1573 domain-containing protein [Pirellulaceae bacterium]HMO91033.1 DUF1573 domain-containing protein [Pirellulaceae bacterium]HMP68148.1 DUF1573 domain-containing protein [Pirellulaceae bacterium]